MTGSAKLWYSRTIMIVCDARSHVEQTGDVAIGQLTSGRPSGLPLDIDVGVEYWVPSGPHVTASEGVPPAFREAATGIKSLAAQIVTRYRFRCPHCGLDVEAGDRIGGKHTSVGYLSVLEMNANTGEPDDDPIRRGVVRGLATDENLTRMADAGVSRVSLTALGRILQM